MAIYSILVAVVLIISVVWFMKQNLYSCPGPLLNVLPVFGYLPFMQKNPREVINQLANIYGPVFQLQYGVHKMVVVSTNKYINELLKKNRSFLWGNPQTVMSRCTAGLSHSDTDGTWKIMRKLAMAKALAKFYAQSPITSDAIATEEFCKIIERFKGQDYRSFNPVPGLTLVLMRIVIRVCFGRGSDVVTTKEMEDLAANYGKYSRGTGPLSVIDALPWLQYIKTRELNEYKAVNIMLTRLVDDHVTQRLDIFKNDGIEGCHDMMDACALSVNKDELLNPEMYQGLYDFLRAGIEGPAVGLHWFVYYMIKYPHIQELLYQETTQYSPEGNRIYSGADEEKLPLVKATIWEILRHSAFNPLSKRIATADVTLFDYTFPKGTYFVPNYYSLSRDETVWENPDDFIPQRFLLADGSFDSKMTTNFLPFGTGPRRCPGEKFGYDILFMGVANLASHVTFGSLKSSSMTSTTLLSEVDDTPITGLTFTPRSYQVKAECV